MSEKCPLVSVIIPTYNRRNTLETAVSSVLQQTYTNLELIIVDDGSTDETECYVAALSDDRVRYYKNEKNLGPSASRNRGVQLAKGEYLAFQDSDDEWSKDKLEKTMHALLLSDEDTAMVYHEMREQSGEIIPSKKIDFVNKCGYIFHYMLLYPLIGIPAAVIKKSCFDDIGGFSNEMKSFEDYEFFLRMAKKYKIAFVEEPLISIYDTPGSVNKQSQNKIDTELYVLKIHLNSLLEFNILQDKLALIRLQADNYGCEDYFYEKLFAMCKEQLAENQAEEVLLNLHKVAMNFVGRGTGDRSKFYQNATQQVGHITESLWRLQNNICNNMQVLIQNRTAIYQALIDVVVDLKEYAEFAKYPGKEIEELDEIEAQLLAEASISTIKNGLDKLLVKSKELLQQINETRCVCTMCGNQVRFLPLSPYQKILRNHMGYTGVGLEFLYENEEKDRCPLCGATQQIRFLVGFMEDIQPEENEQLLVSCMYPQGENVRELEKYIEKYTDSRMDMRYIPSEKVCEHKERMDVLIAVDIFKGEGDRRLLQELRECLKDGGICILMPTVIVQERDETLSKHLDGHHGIYKTIVGPSENDVRQCYSVDEIDNMAKDAGLCLQIIDREWFGAEYYSAYAQSENAKIFLLSR